MHGHDAVEEETQEDVNLLEPVEVSVSLDEDIQIKPDLIEIC